MRKSEPVFKFWLFVTFLLLLSCPTLLFAREADTTGKKKTSTYFFLGGGPATQVNYTIGTGIYIIGPKDNGCKIALEFSSFDAKNLPPGYIPGLFGSDTPNERITSLAVSWWKLFGRPQSAIRPFIDLGPSLLFYRQLKFYSRSIPDNGSLGSNYAKDKVLKTVVGLDTRLGVNFEISNAVAMELAGFSNLNTTQSYLGLNLNLKFNLKP